MGKLNEDVLANMERYKGVVDKEGKKLGMESKYELECTRAYLFAQGYTVSDVSTIVWNRNGIVRGIVDRIVRLLRWTCLDESYWNRK